MFVYPLSLVSALGKTLLEGVDGLVDIVPLGVKHADAHVAEPDVLGNNLLVNATSEHDTTLGELRQEISALDVLRKVDGGHAVGLVVRVGRNLLESEVGNGLLDLVRTSLVAGKPLGEGLGQDLSKGSVKGPDELGRGGGEVRGLLGLIVDHDGQPVLHGGKVGSGGSLAVLEGLDRLSAEHGDGETGRAANSLLAGGDNTIELPLIESNLLAGDTAHTVNNDEGLRGDSVHEGGQLLQLAENTSRGVDVSDGDHLVLLLRQRLLDLGKLGALANGGLELRDVGAVDLEAVGKAIAKVAGTENQNVLTRLNQVGGNDIPAKSSGSRNNEGLRSGVLGLEELAQHGQGLAESRNESRANMALAKGGISAQIFPELISMPNNASRVNKHTPEMTHGVEDGIVELDGARDEQGGVGGLGRHFC